MAASIARTIRFWRTKRCCFVLPVAPDSQQQKLGAVIRPLFTRLLALLLVLISGTALAEDWPRFLGPNNDLHSAETGLLKEFPPNGPPVLWEYPKGSGPPLPVIADDHLVMVHILEGKETIDCLNPETGERIWRVDYPVEANSNYGVEGGSRAGPVIDGDLVFVTGVAGDLHAIELKTGEIAWKTNLDESFGEAPFFFGRGSTPLVMGDKLIVNAGGDACVVAFEKTSGKQLWTATHPSWQASYASPMPATIQGRERVMVFAGGMTSPPEGGLLSIDPSTGTIDGEVPWRSTNFASVNAASPVQAGENAVFITEAYTYGSALVEFDDQFKPEVKWKASRMGLQFPTPIVHEGYIYGFSGSSERGAELVCLEVATGNEMWREDMELTVSHQGREQRVLMGRASLLHADGAFLALGEQGTLAWLDLSPEGAKVLSTTQLFYAPETWGVPALSNGRLYVNQNQRDFALGKSPRLVCYDLRSP